MAVEERSGRCPEETPDVSDNEVENIGGTVTLYFHDVNAQVSGKRPRNTRAILSDKRWHMRSQPKVARSPNEIS